MTPLKFGTHVNANVLGKGAEVMWKGGPEFV